MTGPLSRGVCGRRISVVGTSGSGKTTTAAQIAKRLGIPHVEKAFFSRESILLWALQTYKRRRREYPILLNGPECAHLAIVHLRSPRETRAWIANCQEGKTR